MAETKWVRWGLVITLLIGVITPFIAIGSGPKSVRKNPTFHPKATWRGVSFGGTDFDG